MIRRADTGFAHVRSITDSPRVRTNVLSNPLFIRDKPNASAYSSTVSLRKLVRGDPHIVDFALKSPAMIRRGASDGALPKIVEPGLKTRLRNIRGHVDPNDRNGSPIHNRKAAPHLARCTWKGVARLPPPAQTDPRPSKGDSPALGTAPQ